MRPEKARILTMLALAKGANTKELQRMFLVFCVFCAYVVAFAHGIDQGVRRRPARPVWRLVMGRGAGADLGAALAGCCNFGLQRKVVLRL